MGMYRKKSVVIEAWLWDGWELERPGIPAFVHHSCLFKPDDKNANLNRLLVSTLEGDMRAEPGSWIIQGIKGEVYPCKNDIFLATYEAV